MGEGVAIWNFCKKKKVKGFKREKGFQVFSKTNNKMFQKFNHKILEKYLHKCKARVDGDLSQRPLSFTLKNRWKFSIVHLEESLENIYYYYYYWKIVQNQTSTFDNIEFLNYKILVDQSIHQNSHWSR